jgi:uncharacterized oxidoreductase
MKISENTILVTGGATGIGYAMAEAFLNAGNEVIICGRREEKLAEARKKLSGVNTIRCDVSEDRERKALLANMKKNFKGLNVLVNNAGIQRDIDFTRGDGELSAGESEIRINLEAPIVLSALFLPFLMEHDNPCIINVSSALGFVPMARMPVYCATKAALHSFTLSLRHQLAKSGMQVIEVLPPAVDTELNPEGRKKRNMQPFGVSAEEFVASVMKDLREGRQEIGFGYSNDLMNASREELDKRFKMMNSR